MRIGASHSLSLYPRLPLWALPGISLLITLAESASPQSADVPAVQATLKRPCLAQGSISDEPEGWGDSPPRRNALYDFDRLGRTWSNSGLLDRNGGQADEDWSRRREELVQPVGFQEESAKLQRTFSEMSHPRIDNKRRPSVTKQYVQTRGRVLGFKKILRASRRTRKNHVAPPNLEKTATKPPKRSGFSKRPSQIFISIRERIWKWFRSLRDAVAKFQTSSLVPNYFVTKHELTSAQKKGVLSVFRRDIKHRKVACFLKNFEASHDSQKKSEVITATFETLLARKRIKFQEGYAWIRCFAYISKPADETLDIKIGLALQWGLINLKHQFGFPAKRRKMHLGLLQSIEVLARFLSRRLERQKTRPGAYESVTQVPWAVQLLYPEQGTKLLLGIKDTRQLIEGWLKQDSQVQSYFEALKESSSTTPQETIVVVKKLGGLARNYNGETDTKTTAQTKTAAVVLLQYFYHSPLIKESSLKKVKMSLELYNEVYTVLRSLTSWDGASGKDERALYFQEALINADVPIVF